VMANAQDNRESVKMMTRRSITISSYVIWPLMVGLAVCARPIVALLYTEKWLPCVPFMYIFCFTYALYPIHTANLNAIKAIGRSDLFLTLEILKKIVGICAILISMQYGVMAMAYSLLVTAILSFVINAFPNKKLLKYGYAEQMKDLIPSFFLSVIMGAIVLCVRFLHISNLATLAIQVPWGIFVYYGLSRLFRLDSYEYIVRMIKRQFGHKTKARQNNTIV